MRPLIAMRTPRGERGAVADRVAEVAPDGLVQTHEHVRSEAAREIRTCGHDRSVVGRGAVGVRSRGRRGNEGDEGQVSSSLARGTLQVGVGGREPLPKLRALLTGRLLRPNVDGTWTELTRACRLACKFKYQPVGRAAPALEATTTNVSPSARYCTGVVRVRPERRPVVCSKSTG